MRPSARRAKIANKHLGHIAARSLARCRMIASDILGLLVGGFKLSPIPKSDVQHGEEEVGQTEYSTALGRS